MKSSNKLTLLDELVWLAACLPPHVVVKSSSWGRPSSLNLALAYVDGTPPRFSRLHVAGRRGELEVPIYLYRPGVRELRRALTAHPSGSSSRRTHNSSRIPILVDYPNLSAANFSGTRSYTAALLSKMWGGERYSYSGGSVSELSSRLVVRFQHTSGSRTPYVNDSMVCRLLWVGGSAGHSSAAMRKLPDMTRTYPDGIKLDRSGESIYTWILRKELEDSYFDCLRWDAPRPHSGYHHLKLAALHAIHHGQKTVLGDNFLAIGDIMDDSEHLRRKLFHQKELSATDKAAKFYV